MGRGSERRDLSVPIRLHITDPELLYQAIGFTARETGFDPRLVEKDYFCSVALEYLANGNAALTFKGGTCLAKIHDRFYRLSEDLDFTVSTASDTNRAERGRLIAAAKELMADAVTSLPGFRLREPLTGANSSTQYNGTLEYASLLDGHLEPVRVEISLSEPTLQPTVRGMAETALRNPLTGGPLVPVFEVDVLSYDETMAEKLRAAMCRREVAVRDYFDVDRAVSTGAFNPMDAAMLQLLRHKLAAPRTGPIDVSEVRMDALRRQLDAQLKPMLRESEFAAFELERAVATVRAVAQALEAP